MLESLVVLCSDLLRAGSVVALEGVVERHAGRPEARGSGGDRQKAEKEVEQNKPSRHTEVEQDDQYTHEQDTSDDHAHAVRSLLFLARRPCSTAQRHGRQQQHEHRQQDEEENDRPIGPGRDLRGVDCRRIRGHAWPLSL